MARVTVTLTRRQAEVLYNAAVRAADEWTAEHEDGQEGVHGPRDLAVLDRASAALSAGLRATVRP